MTDGPTDVGIGKIARPEAFAGRPDPLSRRRVSGLEIPPGQINANHLIDLLITTLKIADLAVTTAKLADSAVTALKLATDAVETAKIKDSNVTAVKLATDAVETAKIKDLNVTMAKLAAAAVSSDKLGLSIAGALVAALELRQSSTYGDLATVGPTATITIGANGLAVVGISSRISPIGGAFYGSMGIDVSGANTIAAANTRAITQPSTAGSGDVIDLGVVFFYDALSTGSTTFRAKYASPNGGTGSDGARFQNRRIFAIAF